MHILVSIILPVYNCESYLAQQLDSILNQSLKNFELIIVNDGSTDSTGIIIDNYRKLDDRIRIFDNENSKGVSGALNTGIKYSKAEFIARCDADDVDDKNRLEMQYEFLIKNKDYGIVGSDIIVFSESKKIKVVNYPRNPFILAWKYISNSYFCHPCVMFNKKILTSIELYPNYFAEDFAFFSIAIRTNKGTNLNKILKHYRESPNNASNSKKKEIELDVKSIYYLNYNYYLNNDIKFIEEFYVYQQSGKINYKLLFKILKINFIILNKIRLNYNDKILNKNFIGAILYLNYKLLISSLKNMFLSPFKINI